MNRIPNESFKIAETHVCPTCTTKLDGATPMGDEARRPKDGDLTVCMVCGAILQFSGGRLHVASSELLAALDPETSDMLTATKLMVETLRQATSTSADEQESLGKRWSSQMNQMQWNANAWRAANPTREALVQFNYPKSVCLVAPISEAIKKHLVTCNDAGLELVKALWPWDVQSEATVLMVRIILEHEPE